MLKGSKVIFINLQLGQCTSDFNNPENKSVTILSFNLICKFQNLLAHSRSVSFSPFSFNCLYSFLSVLFKSSLNRDKNSVINSFESCWLNPANLRTFLATQDFTSLGFPALISLFQYCSKRLYHAFANLPPRPSLFVSLISFKNFFVKKYVVNSVQLLKHAMELFIKHVLPKLRPPHTPWFEPGFKTDFSSLMSITVLVKVDKLFSFLADSFLFGSVSIFNINIFFRIFIIFK